MDLVFYLASFACCNRSTRSSKSFIIVYVTKMRARKRGLTSLLASIIGVATLTSCASSAEDLRSELESGGYSNVQIVEAKTRPYVYSTKVNNCTIDLFKSEDKEVWVAIIETTGNGNTLSEQSYQAGTGTFENVGTIQQLRTNQRFAAICP